MRRPWSDIISRSGSYYLLLGRLHPSFGGGPSGPFDSDRLRFASELMKRCCRGLGLQGEFSVEGSREAGAPVVHVAVEDKPDLDKWLSLTGSEVLPSTSWKGRADFDLTDELHDRLLEVGGPPDKRGSARRARAREERDEEIRSLRWRVNANRG